MKKTVISTSLALSLGVAGFALTGHEAHASEAKRRSSSLS